MVSFPKTKKGYYFYTESVIPTIIWINCLLSLTCLTSVYPWCHSSSKQQVHQHFCVYFFRVVDFMLLYLSLTAVLSGRLDTIIGEMLGKVCGRWVGVSGVGGVSARVDVLGWECCSGDSVANYGYETEQAINMGENSGWGNGTRIPASIASNLAFTDVISGSWRNRPLLGPHGRQKCLKANPVDQGLTKLP